MIGFNSNGIAARIRVRGVQAGSEGTASAMVPVTALPRIAAARMAAPRHRRIVQIPDTSPQTRRIPAALDGGGAGLSAFGLNHTGREGHDERTVLLRGIEAGDRSLTP